MNGMQMMLKQMLGVDIEQMQQLGQQFGQFIEGMKMQLDRIEARQERLENLFFSAAQQHSNGKDLSA